MSETATLPESAAEALGGGEVTDLANPSALLEGLTEILRAGPRTSRRAAELASELVRIVAGRSDVKPERGDWRFKDPTWTDNPVYRRWAQAYLAACRAAEAVIDDPTADARQLEKARFLLGILTSAAAPTNMLLGNPAAMKRALETGGSSLVSGARHLANDLVSNGGMPSMATPGSLAVGRDLALTPGAVVSRDEVAELLQFRPTTATVHRRPVLVVPPPIGRYYFLDLRPGRSFVEYAVSRGLQVFLISWRNPGPDQASWNLDTYAARVRAAILAVQEISRCEDVNLIGFCAGGILGSTVLNNLAATNEGGVHSASFAVTLLDFGQTAPIAAFSSAKLLSLARWNSRRKGIITARAMGSVFSWMRPNELVWNYWVNNYLLGQDPPVFDILSWNADGTNLPAALHEQFLDIFEHNPLVHPGAFTVLDTPLDLSRIQVPTFVTGAVNDHLTPWRGCYRTTQLLSGESTFVLSNAGHIASLVNPPGNPKASYRIGPADASVAPDAWLERAEPRGGSWWEAWADWTASRSGEEKPAPRGLGSRKHRAGADAPGAYVRQAN